MHQVLKPKSTGAGTETGASLSREPVVRYSLYEEVTEISHPDLRDKILRELGVSDAPGDPLRLHAWYADTYLVGQNGRPVVVKMVGGELISNGLADFEPDSPLNPSTNLTLDRDTLRRNHPVFPKLYGEVYDSKDRLLAVSMEYIPGDSITTMVAKRTINVEEAGAIIFRALFDLYLTHSLKLKDLSTADNFIGERVIDGGSFEVDPKRPQSTKECEAIIRPIADFVTRSLSA